jgi:hypothetical protein
MRTSSNRTSARTRGAFTHARRLSATAAALALSSATITVGDVVQWTGNVSESWNTGANWTTGNVPADGDAVILLGGGFYNVFLNAHSANLQSLYIGNLKAVTNFGYVLEVTSSPTSTTTITGGHDSLLHLVPVSGGGYGFRTRTLHVNNDAKLQMAGGRARVLEQLTLSNGGQILGHGFVEVHAPHDAALNAHNGGPLNVFGGDLRILVGAGGSMALPDQINITQADRELWLQGPHFLPIRNVNLGDNSTLRVDNVWTLSQTLFANPGAGSTSYITGNGTMISTGTVSVNFNGALTIAPPVAFTGGNISVSNAGTLTLQNIHEANAGHLTTLAANSTLRINGSQLFADWAGDINSTAGIIETNTPIGHWNHTGNLTLGSFGGLRTQINGSAAYRAFGNVSAPGLGAIVNGTFELHPPALMTLGAGAQIITNGTLTIKSGSQVTGGGLLTVNPTGTLVLEQAVPLQANILNHGQFEIGSGDSVGYAIINGAFTQGPTGSMKVDIAGYGDFSRDIWEALAPINLAGNLHINLTNGFTPNVGDEFMIIWANDALNGSFDTVTGEPGFSVHYVANTVRLVYDGLPECPADINGDGVVDGSDLLVLLAAWGQTPGSAADLNGDSVVDGSDLLILLAAWGSCG